MKLINALLRIIAFFILLLVILALPLALFGQAIARVVFSPDAIVGVAEENLLDVEMLASVAEQSVETRLAEGPSQPDIEPDPIKEILLASLGNLDHAQWVQLFNLIAPPDLVSQTLRELIVGAFVWIDSPNPNPSITVTTSGWKTVIDQNFPPALQLVVDALPDCTAEQALLFGSEVVLEDEDVEIPLCRPPEPLYSEFIDQATQLAPDQLSVLPDQLTLGRRFPDAETTARMERLQSNLRFARTLLRWSWLAVLGTLAFAVLLAARSWAAALKWAGWPFILSGLLTLLLSTLLFIIAGSLLASAAESMFSEAPQALLQPFLDTARAALGLLSRPLLIEGVSLILLAVLGLIAASRLGKAKSVPAP